MVLFPNPANQMISVETDGNIEEILIQNTMGQVSFKSNDMNGIRTEIDISQMTIGLYYISVRLENGRTEIRKIIKN